MRFIPFLILLAAAGLMYWSGWRSMQKKKRLIEHIKTRGPIDFRLLGQEVKCPVEGCSGLHEAKP